jgi:hypothetical protein
MEKYRLTSRSQNSDSYSYTGSVFLFTLSEKPVFKCAGVLLPLLVLAPFTTWILFKGLRHQPDRQLNGTGQPRARDLLKNMIRKSSVPDQ